MLRLAGRPATSLDVRLRTPFSYTLPLSTGTEGRRQAVDILGQAQHHMSSVSGLFPWQWDRENDVSEGTNTEKPREVCVGTENRVCQKVLELAQLLSV